jgi:hypothetical protein
VEVVRGASFVRAWYAMIGLVDVARAAKRTYFPALPVTIEAVECCSATAVSESLSASSKRG